MGGSRGGSWYSWSPKSRDTSVDKAVSDAATASRYDADANAYLQDLLSGYNNRDTNSIQKHIETLKRAVEREIEGEIETRFGGSVRKHTYVDGLSDVDVLMVLNN